MSKIQSTVLLIGFVFFLTFTAAGCAETGTDTRGSSTMGNTDAMKAGMKNMPDDTMNKNLEKPMDRMNADKMDQVIDTMK